MHKGATGSIAVLPLLWLSALAVLLAAGCGSTGEPVALDDEPPDASSAEVDDLTRARAVGPHHVAVQAEGKEDPRYHLERRDQQLRGHNFAHGFDVAMDAAGFELSHQHEGWRARFETRGIRCGDQRLGVAQGHAREVDGEPHRGAIERAAGKTPFEEWTINLPLGLEQGFTLPEDPCGGRASEIVIEVGVEGLTPVKRGEAIALIDEEGGIRATVSELYAYDAEGRVLDGSLVAADAAIEIRVDVVGARWPLVVDPVIASQVQKLAQGVGNSRFGHAVALDGDNALVGAPQQPYGANVDQGHAYLWMRSGGNWGTPRTLIASDGAAGDRFGSSVAMEGTTAVVGAPLKTVGVAQAGAAYVFMQSGTSWTQRAQLVANPASSYGRFGTSVAVEGTTALVAGTNKVYVFEMSGASWNQVAQPSAGQSVSLSGATALAGAPSQDSNRGGAYVLARSGGTWTQQTTLIANDGVAGDSFGSVVALKDTTALVAAPGADVGGRVDQGAVYVFVRSGTSWTQQKKLVANDGVASDAFGTSVAWDGATALVGAPLATIDGNVRQGAAYLSVQSGSNWTEPLKLKAADGGPTDQFGASVAVSRATALVGAPIAKITTSQFGAAYLFSLQGVAGTPCGGYSDCATNYTCVDGICCNSACSGACEICSATLGAPRDGICTPLPQGTTPLTPCAGNMVCNGDEGFCPAACTADVECAQPGNFCTSAGTCQPSRQNGAPCDPSGDCKDPTSTDTCHLCASNNCIDGVCCNSTCSGACDRCDVYGLKGSCSPVPMSSTVACGTGYLCNGTLTSCPSSCTSDANCQSGYFCNGTQQCSPLLSAGGACNQTSQCVGGLTCVDGFCCGATNCGACQTCQTGQCGPDASLNGLPDPSNRCIDNGPASCGYDGLCDNGQCGRYPTGTTCGARYCDGNVSKERACNGSGTCLTTSGTDCGAFQCQPGAPCPTSCTGDNQCVSGTFCSLGNCVTKANNGGACTAANQCASGYCADGFCCNSPCGGICMSCKGSETGQSNGVCAPVTYDTDPSNDCTTVSPPCGYTGTCDGTGACKHTTSGASCGSACSGITLTSQVCNGNGTCIAGSVSTCPDGYTCNTTGACRTSCTADSQCIASYHCTSTTGGTCAPDKSNGAACASGAQCFSGFCVDGVCCDASCTGACTACSAALKGSGADGVCGPVLPSVGPQPECPAAAASTCGATGLCNGSGACAMHPVGTACGATSCAAGWQTGQSCNGFGTCVSSSNTSCAPYVCNGAACGTSCTTDSECLASYYCGADSKCHPDQALGATCSSNSQCASGSCADGVCCDTACQGVCQACSVAKKGGGTEGVCGNIASGGDPDDECFDENPSTCGRSGTCSGNGTCALYTAGTVCGATTCAGGIQTGYACNGLGSCLTSATVQCSPYFCSGSVCAAQCNSDSDCAAVYYCAADKTCKVDQPKGATCTAASQCASGNCVDGYCCDTACSGTCVACSQLKKGSGLDGDCGPMAGGTDPDDECGDQDAASCGTNGACSGAASCALYPAGTACGSTTCSGGTQSGQACNGSGTCIDASTASCSPYQCGGNACGTSCVDDSQCVGAYYCDLATGTCKPDQAIGSSCMSKSQCALGHCVDGFCCDTACEGTCLACSTSKKGAGSDGVCSAIVNGADPDNECSDQGPASCGTNGRCNGSGACAVYSNGTACGTTTCDSGSGVQVGQACDGSGTCVDAQTSSCAPYVCVGSSCAIMCVDDSQCIASYFCNETLGVCAPDQDNGASCQIGGECKSGNCVDGFCCDTGCEGTCSACSADKKGAGSDGVCGSIYAGSDPDNECAEEGPDSCGLNGACDGSGSCALYAPGAACGITACASGIQTGKSCNGQGVCLDSTTVNCAPYSCLGNACAGVCTDDSQCGGNYFCDLTDNTCKPDQPIGAQCTSGSQCQNQSCVDGVCCDTACQGTCQACSNKKTGGPNGVCGNITADQDPDGECEDQGPASCLHDGQCDGKGACQYYAHTTPCGQTSCNGNVVIGEICDGLGTCTVDMSGSDSDCSPHLCVSGGCANPCGTDEHCMAGYYCQQGACVPQQGPGQACTGPGECGAGLFCVDGVCCNSACTGQCEACDSTGACHAVTGEPVGGRPTCSGQGQCAGVCDGTNRAECSFPGGAVLCETVCVGHELTTSTCNGSGKCLPGTPTPCDPYMCDQATCKTSCTSDADCLSPAKCDDGQCNASGGTGGAGGSGGSSNGGGAGTGSEPDAGIDSVTTPAAGEDPGGCGCRAARESSNSRLGLLSLAAIAVLVRRRRSAVRARGL